VSPRRSQRPARPGPGPGAAGQQEAPRRKAFEPPGGPRLQWGHEGRRYPDGASYQLAGCRCLTSVSHAGDRERSAGAWCCSTN